MPRPLHRLPPVRPLCVVLLLVLLAMRVPTADASIVLGPWSPHGGQAGAAFGASVAPAGDVNGDGFSDVLVGAPLYDNGQTDEGRAFLFLGSPSGPAASPAWTWEPNQAGAQAGLVVAPAGDVNQDGFADVLVCVPLWDQPGHVDAGEVVVFYGSALGLPAAPSLTLFNDVTNARFGASATTAGDVNGDQYADVIIGSPGFANGQANEGKVYVFHGGPSGLSNVATFTLEGGEIGARAGAAVSGAGDVNADTYGDVLIGMPGASPNGRPDSGRALLLRGSATGVDAAVPLYEYDGPADSSEAGGGVSLVGDLNADGYGDIMIGVPNDDGVGVRRGQVLFLRGTSLGIDPTPMLAMGGRGDGSRVGSAIATGGDLDGDGFSDALVGNRLEPNTAQAGSVQLLFGTWKSAFQRIEVLLGTLDGEHLGASVATAGDFNGDGLAEVLAGCPDYGIGGNAKEGRVVSYLVGVNLPALVVNAPQAASQPDTHFGNALAIVRQIESGTYPSVLVGETGYPTPAAHTGRVVQYRAVQNGFKLPATRTFDGSIDDGYFGTSVVDAGDVDRDGMADFVIGSPEFSSGALSKCGRAVLYRGDYSGFGPVLSPWTAVGDQTGSLFGATLAGRGDVNGDGYSDVLVGAWNEGVGPLARAGKVWLYPGGPTGLGAPTWTAQGTVTQQYFGYALALADLDGDGYSDAVVSDASTTPRVFVYFGGPGGLSSEPAWTILPSPALGSFGGALAGVGDFDGDGVGDLAVGASADFTGGAVFLYRGSSARSQPLGPYRSYIAPAGTSDLGYSIGGGGDLNGDGLGDFVVGAPTSTNGESSEGRILVFLGRGPLSPFVPDTTYESNIINQALGSAIAPLADLNDDGFADIVASGTFGTGRVYAWFGGGGGPIQRFASTEAYAAATRFTPALLDSATKVGYAVYYRSPAGRTRVGAVFELLPQNTPFTGIPNQREFNQGFYDTGPVGSTGSFGGLVSYLYGLWPGVTYHWRYRGITRSPYFPRTHWIAPEARASGDSDFRTGGTNVAVPGDSRGSIGRLDRIAPNPAVGPTTIGFSLPARATIRLDVYDVRGRHVRTLARGEAEAGVGARAWDGADDAGRRVPPGLYFVELRAGAVVDRSRVVRLN